MWSEERGMCGVNGDRCGARGGFAGRRDRIERGVVEGIIDLIKLSRWFRIIFESGFGSYFVFNRHSITHSIVWLHSSYCSNGGTRHIDSIVPVSPFTFGKASYPPISKFLRFLR